MRIMYLTQWFDPEPNVIKGPRFVRALEAAGHEVGVVTGLPNYLTGRLYPGYRMGLLQRETMGGVGVTRLPLYPSHDSSPLRRSLNYLSFFASALAYGLFRRRPFDLAYVYHPPMTVGLAAALSGLVRRLPFVIEIQDLWPDTIAATRMGDGLLVGLLGLMCRFVYRRAAAIIVQSEGMRRTLIERGVPAAKLTTIRNWAGLEPEGEPAERPADGEGFTVVYAGNHGRSQALEAVLDAAALIQAKRQDIRFRFYSGGIEAGRIQAVAERLGLGNVSFHGHVPEAEILAAFARADALLLHLRAGPLFEVTIPSKTQTYLAMGRPIVAGVSGETAEILRRSGAAVIAPPEQPQALAEAICALADMPLEQRQAMGRAGRAFYREALSFDQAIERTLAVLERARTGARTVRDGSLEARTPWPRPSSS
jgi:glycosyltransferase involved in cell wall biosynthesis